MILRDYQERMKQGIYDEWRNGHRYVLGVLPTGGGKTRLIASITGETNGATVEIAHRQELVFQISMALAENGIYHRIIAPDKVVRFIASIHASTLGRSFVHSSAPHTVASVQTLNARADDLAKWMRQVILWQMDEAHHGLVKNAWGRAILRFVNARGVGWTATPTRADRRALRYEVDDETGVPFGGCYQAMVTGPEVRDLITAGHLCDYRIYGPPISIDLANVEVSKSSGDFNPNQLRDAAHRSTITGDIVEHAIRLAPGELGVSFVVDVEQAIETVAKFRARGVPAEMISGDSKLTSDEARIRIMRDFRQEIVKEIVNIDIVGEGVDVPGIVRVSMGRPTESFGLYRQQAGRALRPKVGKSHGIIVDHVGNVQRHGLPDRIVEWSLDVPVRRRRRSDGSEIPDENSVTTCTNPACLRVYERFKPRCPYCSTTPAPARRDRPEFVDGDLHEYTPELMRQLTGEANRIMGDFHAPRGMPSTIQPSAFLKWGNRSETQKQLRESIALWAGVEQQIHGRSDAEIYRRFYLKFGVDIMTAQTLGSPEATKLRGLVCLDTR